MKVFVIAGEVSGDMLGGGLMAALRTIIKAEFDGVGGPVMQDQGLTSRFPMDELSVMGITEILPKYLALKKRVHQIAQAVIETRPDVLITIDCPEFCLRVARLVKARTNIPIIHYVAPTVWAWRAGRAAKMARHIDHVLAILPFEPPYMHAAGMSCDFVGHPVVAEPIATSKQAQAFRDKHGAMGPMVLALPGSRKSEVTRLSERFGDALGQVAQAHPNATFVVPCAEPVTSLVRELSQSWPVTPLLIPAQATATRRAAFRAADVALAVSGTVSLELAASGTPMAIGYDMAPLSRFIMRRMVRLDTVTLVNLVSETHTVPECLGAVCTADRLAQSVLSILTTPTSQRDAMRLTMERLGQNGTDPNLRAAHSVLKFLKHPSVEYDQSER